ncbi:hypothetical protein CW357_07390 [Rummeliibacillus sp. TYF005]|uniref:hypothetical protein n=1 Tax=Rummeliibacillus sp. TYF005 TaxID=2058214 RepID=UPI000F5329BD|nr:hypothetical protein [Rummeliibacillus sp. TYF005]RPJ96004.1 hypothetical protein CW357_07390 [Rummeliibacillus sp. TYF005]
MNVTSLVSNRYAEVENRKRALRQKTADDAYRKNAQYFKPKFNPALEELVDLLTGKKEKDHQPEVQAAIQDLKQQKDLIEQQNSPVDDEVASAQLADPISSDEKYAQTITILEDVRDAALAPENPSQQDLQVAATASETIQETQSQSTHETKLSNVFQMNDHGKEESATTSDSAVIAQEKTKQRLFKKAIAHYSFHMQMAKQGFHFAEPIIYRAV